MPFATRALLGCKRLAEQGFVKRAKGLLGVANLDFKHPQAVVYYACVVGQAHGLVGGVGVV